MENKNRLIPSVKTEVRGKYMRNKKNIMFYVLYSVLPMSEIPQKSHRIPPRIKSDFQTRIFRKRDVHMIVYPGITENRDIFIAVFLNPANIRKPYTVIALYG